MLYYLRLKDANNGNPYYNEAGWKNHKMLATVYDSRNEAKAAAFKEGLDQEKFEIRLLRLNDIIDEIRRHMAQPEFIDLITKGSRNEVESKYKEITQEKAQKCPKCGKAFVGHPAISRVDNKTNICPSCGLREAMEAFMKEKGVEADA